MYVRMIQEENQGEKISRKTQGSVYHLLGKEGQRESQDCGEIQDKVFLAACVAEENGFVMGFKYAFHLFTECMQE